MLLLSYCKNTFPKKAEQKTCVLRINSLSVTMTDTHGGSSWLYVLLQGLFPIHPKQHYLINIVFHLNGPFELYASLPGP